MIPLERDPKFRQHDGKLYIGVGVIKKVIIRANDPLLTLIFQMDILNPTDRKHDQDIPLKNVNYKQTLDLRVLFDNSMVETQKRTIQENLKEPAPLLWTQVKYNVLLKNSQRIALYLILLGK